MTPDARPPRVAYVTSSQGVGGGAEHLLAALVAGGGDRGWDQLVLNPFGTDASRALADLCPAGHYRGRRCDRWNQLPGLRRWLQRELDRFQPDVVHVVLLQALFVVATLRKRPGARWLLTHVYGDVFGVRRFGPIDQHVDRWAGRRFDHVVAISDAVREFLVTDHRYPAAKVTRIQPGWEGEPLPRTDEGPPTVISVGKLRPEKGHDVLLLAFDLVRRQVPAARLVIVGDGDLRPSLEAKARALGLTDAVTFAGAVTSIWPYLARAWVFASASLSEAFGIAVVEAMAAGLPVVAPAVGAIPELVTPGVTGELYPSRNHEALAHHLVKLLGSPELRHSMGEAGRQTAAGFHMARTVDRYFDLYDELLGRAVRAHP